MKNEQRITFDYYDIAEAVLAQLKTDAYVPEECLTHQVVSNAIYQWIDEYYLRSIMRWCEPVHDGVERFVAALNIDTGEADLRDSIYDWACESIVESLNEMLRGHIGNSTWLELDVLRVGATAFMLQIGEDHRVVWYMKNMYHQQPPSSLLKRRKRAKRVNAIMTPMLPSKVLIGVMGLNFHPGQPKYDNVKAEVVDSVSFGSRSAFPYPGLFGKMYIDRQTRLSYEWTGDRYVIVNEDGDA